MEYLIPTILTFVAIWSIIKVVSNRRWGNSKYFMFSQSAMHNRVRLFMPTITIEKEKIFSQSDKHISKNMTKVIVIGGKAYWTSDNIFYVADVNNGNVIAETTKQVDASEMSKEELDKMLKILDNLNSGRD